MSPEPSGEPWDLRPVPVDHPDARALTVQVQRYYTEVYGAPDDTPMTAAEFAPPDGGFVVAYLDDRPVAMGGWRIGEPTDFAARPVELKRMYVVPELRRRGLAGRLLARLEAEAAAAGADWAVLETGTPQPAAVALYTAAGYRPVPAFGHYADSPDSIELGKPLGRHATDSR